MITHISLKHEKFYSALYNVFMSYFPVHVPLVDERDHILFPETEVYENITFFSVCSLLSPTYSHPASQEYQNFIFSEKNYICAIYKVKKHERID